jgi:hypothetical protein
VPAARLQPQAEGGQGQEGGGGGALRYRNIHCKIWNDDKFPFASDDCQLVIFHLLTTPFSTPYGLYKASVAALAAEKRWPLKRYEKAFREALRIGFLRYDERHHVVLIPKCLDYNPPQSPNVVKSWRPSYEEMPESELKEEFFRILKALVEGYGEGYREAFRKAFPEVSRKSPDTDTDTDTDSDMSSLLKPSQELKRERQREAKKDETPPKGERHLDHVCFKEGGHERLKCYVYKGHHMNGELELYIERLNDYIRQIGAASAARKYKDHEAVLKNWFRRDVDEKAAKGRRRFL